MALENYQADMAKCSRCSSCKWIPFAQVKSWRFAKGCPSVDYGKFHAYSAGGRYAVALALLDGRIDYTDKLLEIVYMCQMDGACDVACKMCRYLEPLETMLEFRTKLVEDGQLLPQHIPLIDNLRREDNMMMQPKTERGKWAEGLEVKDLSTEKAKVVFHSGCHLGFDKELGKVAKTALTLLQNAGVDVGIFKGQDETCCGGRANELGYRGELIKYAESITEAWATTGVKTVITACSDCYHAFKVTYPKIGKKVNVLHITEYLNMLVKNGKLKLTKEVPLKVTYHDPCHLGRLGETHIPWEGEVKKFRVAIDIHEPQKPIRRGAQGVYEPPRELLRSIPDLELVEMERIREYSWCCGAGGCMQQTYPDYSLWTARERIEEAKSTGAKAIVSACPWCERNFIDTIKATDEKMMVFDVVELIQQAI